MNNISLWRFIWLLLTNWSIHLVIKNLDDEYGDSSDYTISLFNCKLYILQTKPAVKEVLLKKAQITYVNKTFFNSHGHFYGIGNLDVKTDHVLWSTVHNGLKHAISLDNLAPLMKSHSDILTYKYNFNYCINDVLEEYMCNVWGKYCFGLNTNIETYKLLRTKIIFVINKTFHNNSTNSLPLLGPLICNIKRFIYRRELLEIDDLLKELISNGEHDGFIHKFQDNISTGDNNNNDQIVLDNAFLSVLVYDFLYMHILESVVKTAKYQIDSHKQRILNKNIHLKNAFLFPMRFRKISSTEYSIINLISSDFLFSYGLRACVGTGFSDKFYDIFYEILRNYEIQTSDLPVIYSPNLNTPIITSKHNITLTMQPTIFKDLIPSYTHNNINNFYKIEAITENVELYNYTINRIVTTINKMNYFKNIDGIITAESRGFLIAPPMILLCKLPVYSIRKKGKLSGTVISETYQKQYGEIETIEMSYDEKLKGKRMVIVDDGIASGVTTQAMYNLAKRMGISILHVFVVVKHTYTKNIYNETGVTHIFEL